MLLLALALFTLAARGSCGAAGLSCGEPFLPAAKSDAMQGYPAAAYARGIYLAVWQEGHYGWGKPADTGIRGARIGADGKLLDTLGILVSDAADFQERPVVATDGRQFLVVWQDMRNGHDYDLYAARVSVDGKVLDPDGIPVSRGTGSQCAPAVSFDGTNFIVAWMDNRGVAQSYDIRAARVSPAGAVLDPEGTVVDGFDRSSLQKKLGSDNLIGLPLDSFPRIACKRGECLVGWIYKTPPYSWDEFVRFKLVSTSGAITVHGDRLAPPKHPLYEQGNVRKPTLAVAAGSDGFWALFSGVFGKGDSSFFVAGLGFPGKSGATRVAASRVRANGPGQQEGQALAASANGNQIAVWSETDSDYTLRPPRPTTYRMVAAVGAPGGEASQTETRKYQKEYLGNPVYVSAAGQGLLLYEEMDLQGLISVRAQTCREP